ncbi:MAG: hypothetical protein LBS55_13630 [Prevotellaceae bacterium]|nr:hypothetical protein [Prevotellaceae bacterium]
MNGLLSAAGGDDDVFVINGSTVAEIPRHKPLFVHSIVGAVRIPIEKHALLFVIDQQAVLYIFVAPPLASLFITGISSPFFLSSFICNAADSCTSTVLMPIWQIIRLSLNRKK